MDDVIEWLDRPELTDAVAVMAFRGWNDAGEAASTAAEFVRDQSLAQLVAVIDYDDFNDHQSNRPHVVIDGEGTRAIDWPDARIYAVARRTRDLVVVIGEEPSMRWKEFCRVITRAMRGLNVSEVVTMGAFLGEVAHSLEVPIMGLTDGETRERHGLLPSSYEGPTGIVGVLTQWLAHAGLDSKSLWAASPHYLASTPNPKAAVALVEKFGLLTGVEVDAGYLSPEVVEWEKQVEEAIADNEELEEYVQQLHEVLDDSTIPAGSEEKLVDEIEDFLREQ